jgi:hypothetical protein
LPTTLMLDSAICATGQHREFKRHHRAEHGFRGFYRRLNQATATSIGSKKSTPTICIVGKFFQQRQ